MDLKNITPKILAFIVILITIALAKPIYTANLAIVNYNSGSGGLADFIGLGAIAQFGAFLLIFGIMIEQGMLNIAGMSDKAGGGVQDGWKSMTAAIGTIILALILLSMFAQSILPQFKDLVTTASLAGDSIGQFFWGIIPIFIYLGIIALGVLGNGGGSILANKIRGRKGRKQSNQNGVAYGAA